ncbi:unnamed protein product [Mucor circinelloides]
MSTRFYPHPLSTQVQVQVLDKIAAEAVKSSEQSSQESCDSIDYHPTRKLVYKYKRSGVISNDRPRTVEAKWTVQDENIVAELQKIARRSELLAADDTNHLSDVRLLTLDYIYFFSNEHIKSTTRYMPKRLHKAVLRDLANAYDDDDQLDVNVFSWCHQAANIKFDQDYRYMTIQAITTIEIMSQAISTQIKGNLIVVNMIHTM